MVKDSCIKECSSDFTAIEVRSSGVHGLGAFARSNLRRGQLVGKYAGRQMGADDAVHRDDGLTYLFALSDGGYIDGAQGGNTTRFINHSCEPNCLAEEYHQPGGRLGVRIRTLRPIAEAQELFLDYSLIVDVADPPDAYPCHCGATTCRRTMVSPATDASPDA